jgi:uncharacterized protein YndB with AHSA1/START domain
MTPDAGAAPELGELTIVRVHAAPIELLFELMTTPEHLTHFWGGKGTHTPLENITVDCSRARVP